MTPAELEEKYKDIPECLALPVAMNGPNGEITIHKGVFQLKADYVIYELDGEISFHWLPALMVRFEGSVTSGGAMDFNYDLAYDVQVAGLRFGTGYVTNRSIGSGCIYSGHISRAIHGDKSIGVTEVAFGIPNMKEFFGSVVKTVSGTEISTNSARLSFKSGNYTIWIDKMPSYKTDHAELKGQGGYLLLYAGKITSDKGTIVHGDLTKWLGLFHHFLHFLCGRRNAPLFLTGKYEGEVMWQDFTPYNSDVYKYVPCWSDVMHVDGLQELWDVMERYWQDDVDRDFLQTAIHWYVEANAGAAYVEGSIILAQTALELIYNWLLIEKKKIIIGKDAEGLSASNKIRLILTQLNITPEIPAHFTELLDIPDYTDGPEVFVQIRNALVHGQERKRRELMNISTPAKHDALQLALWYIELSLLKILEYKGKYKNRVSTDKWFGLGEALPWNVT